MKQTYPDVIITGHSNRYGEVIVVLIGRTIVEYSLERFFLVAESHRLVAMTKGNQELPTLALHSALPSVEMGSEALLPFSVVTQPAFSGRSELYIPLEQHEPEAITGSLVVQTQNRSINHCIFSPSTAAFMVYLKHRIRS